MRLDRYLESRLQASARAVRLLLAGGAVTVDGVTERDGRCVVGKFSRITANSEPLQSKEAVYLMLHKPVGCVSATHDPVHLSVLDLIHHPSRDELHLAGRLDFNTTGLLLLSNDGEWSSGITLPGRRTPKTYRVETRDVITPEYVERFRQGVDFRYENLRTQPAILEILAPRLALLTLVEGRYHQVKRMFGSFRNPVLSLHRISIGTLHLDDALLPGQYRPLTEEEVASLRHARHGRRVSDGASCLSQRAVPECQEPPEASDRFIGAVPSERP